MPPDKTSEYNMLVKELLGSLERIMLAFRSLPEKDITIAAYCHKYKFTGISPLLTDGCSLKDLDVCTVVALYETFEQDMAEIAWKTVPEEYAEPLEKSEEELLRDMFSRLYEKIDDLPTFDEFKECTNRFCMRCLTLGEFKLDEELPVWLCDKPDFWPHEFDQEKLYFLKADMPLLKVDKVVSMHRCMQAFEDSVPAALKQKMIEMTRKKSSRLMHRTSSYIG